VVENGLFLNICDTVIVGNADGLASYEMLGQPAEITQMVNDAGEHL